MEKITQDSYKLYINGQWIDASDGATFQTRCPANGEGLATCAQATREDVDQAVDAAWAAFRSWKNVTTNERAAILNRIADINRRQCRAPGHDRVPGQRKAHPGDHGH